MSDSERVQYKFMIPATLKERLEAEAAGARRSLSAEIVARLEQSLEVEDDLDKRLRALELAVAAFERKHPPTEGSE